MDAETIVEKLQVMFGDKLADPDVFPRVFGHQVKMAKYELQLESEQHNETKTDPSAG